MLKLLAGLPRGEHNPDPLGQQATRDERQRQRRCLIEPLRVIDHAQQRTLLGYLREQAQDPQPDEKPIRSRASAQPEHDLERLPLRSRKPPKPIEQRPAKLMQAGVRQLHLRLHPHRPHDRKTRRRLDQALQQRRLPNPRLATQNQRPRLAAADVLDRTVQHGTLAAPPEQARAPPGPGARFSMSSHSS